MVPDVSTKRCVFILKGQSVRKSVDMMDLIILKDGGNTFFRSVGNRFPKGTGQPVSIHWHLFVQVV
jgi:hypothetical protein